MHCSFFEVSQKTAVDWYNFIRDVCTEYFQRNPLVIGGPGVEVETDKSTLGRRKYSRGIRRKRHTYVRTYTPQ